ncbi:MAG: dihydropyrimidinase [Paracoccaceae bacterium]|nr:dihydropyrimidinase [Paracoccaceae bacterium]
MHDLVIEGGTIVTATESFRGDIGITNGTIATLGKNLDGREKIDATGRLVLPGGIEAHCHIAQESATGGMTSDDYSSGSVSAAFGGNTCFIPFAAQHRGMGIKETLDLYDSRSNGSSVIDYSYHLIIADPTPDVMDRELPDAVARGITSFKVFMTYDLMKVSDEQFLDILSAAKRHGALTMVHAENSGIINWVSERLVKGGYTTPRYHAISHPEIAEVEAISRAIMLAKFIDTPLMIVHVSTSEGAELVLKAKNDGLKIFSETCPQYLFLDRNDLDRPGYEGAKFICSPPLRTKDTQEALWKHLQLGTFTIFSSDHSPYRFDKSGKLANGPNATFQQIANGMPGIAMRLPLLFSEGVNKGRITLQKFVELSSTNAARTYGLLPKKGSISIGADADLVIWDPNLKRRVTIDDQHDAMDYTPFEGMEVTGWPMSVIVRGSPVILDGNFVGSHAHGKFTPRGKTDLTGFIGHKAAELDIESNFGADLCS